MQFKTTIFKFAIFIVGCLEIVHISRDYLSFATIKVQEITATDNIPLPAVSICNDSKLTFYNKFAKHLERKLKKANATKGIKRVYSYYIPSLSLFPVDSIYRVRFQKKGSKNWILANNSKVIVSMLKSLLCFSFGSHLHFNSSDNFSFLQRSVRRLQVRLSRSHRQHWRRFRHVLRC